MLVWRKYGIVPATEYAGVLAPDGRHDDEAMVAEMRAYLKHINEHEIYDMKLALASLQLIMGPAHGPTAREIRPRRCGTDTATIPRRRAQIEP